MTHIQHPRTTDEHNRRGRIYYFAKPAHAQHRLAACIKPLLLTQMQRFDSLGHLESTIDVLSVSFLTSRLIKDVRHFIRQKKRTPDFVIMSDDFHPVASASPNDDQTSKTFVGAASMNSHSTGARDGWVRTACDGELSFTMFNHPDDTYDVSMNGILVFLWKPKKLEDVCLLSLHHELRTKTNEKQEIQCFELTELKTMTVVAQLRQDCLRVIGRRSLHDINGDRSLYHPLSDGEERMVLFTAVWVAYQEGWFALEIFGGQV